MYKKHMLYFSVAIFATIAVSAIITPIRVSAIPAGPSSDPAGSQTTTPSSFAVKEEIKTSAQLKIYRQYVAKCFDESNLNGGAYWWNSTTLSADAVSEYKWFHYDTGNTPRPFISGTNAPPMFDCKNEDLMKEAVEALGIGDGDPELALCQIGLRKKGQTYGTPLSDCTSTSEEDFSTDNDFVKELDNALANINTYSTKTLSANYSSSEKYLIAMSEFLVGCDAEPYKLYENATSDEKSATALAYYDPWPWRVSTVISDGSIQDTLWRSKSNNFGSHGQWKKCHWFN